MNSVCESEYPLRKILSQICGTIGVVWGWPRFPCTYSLSFLAALAFPEPVSDFFCLLLLLLLVQVVAIVQILGPFVRPQLGCRSRCFQLDWKKDLGHEVSYFVVLGMTILATRKTRSDDTGSLGLILEPLTRSEILLAPYENIWRYWIQKTEWIKSRVHLQHRIFQ